MRLIDAEKLAKDLYRVWALWGKKGKDCYIISDIITPIIITQPTIEAEPIKHGHWESKFENGKINTYCSACGGITYGLYHYCPNCGAKMGEEEE